MYQLVEKEVTAILERTVQGPLANAGCFHHMSLGDQLSRLRSYMLFKDQWLPLVNKVLDMPIVLHYDNTDHYNKIYAKTPAGWAEVTMARQEELCDLTMGMINIPHEEAADYLTGHRNSLYTLEALAAIRHQ